MNKEKYAKQDEQLYYHIKNLQAGNVESYTEIYNLSCKYFYKIIYDIVGDYHTTEDMLQETFLKIYNNIGSLQSPEAFYVWAGRIATNLCIRYIHKYRKEVLTTASEDGEGNEEFIFDTVAEDNEMFIPESVLDNKEHQRMIGEVIDSLSVEQKLAVQCFYFEEMSVKEIAALMECSEGTIKSRLNYARKSIKDSVLHIEKTQGTKLYSFGALPILLLLYKNMAQAAVPAAATAGVGSALAGNMASGGVVSGATVGAGTGGVTSGVTSGVASGVTGATVGAASSAGAAATAAGISGKLVAIKSVTDDNDLMIIYKSGITIRMHLADFRIMGRATQGVRLINLEKRNDEIGSVCKVTAEVDEEATASRKETLEASAKTDYFNNTLAVWVEEYPLTINESVWEQVVFDRSYDIKPEY